MEKDFITAYFTNNERTVVGIVRETPDQESEWIEHIVAEEGNPKWEALLKDISIDQLHENTWQYLKQLDAGFKNQVIEVAKERGLIYDIDAVNTDIYKALAKAFFEPFDPEKDKEKLFILKIQLFEVPQIRECKDKNLKASLRKSTTILEALKISIKIVESTVGTTA
tara:strand:+ start:5596 stop:6096 length:501 start_codon:yes stop_codon:yes gene_type:complete